MSPLPHELRPCGDCGAAVLITVTRHGRHMPVNPQPDDTGNQACYRAGVQVWHSRSLDGADARPLDPWEHSYVPHVATCTGHQPPLPLHLPNVVPIDLKRRRRRRPR